jgi:hypothetical protein
MQEKNKDIIRNDKKSHIGLARTPVVKYPGIRQALNSEITTTYPHAM